MNPHRYSQIERALNTLDKSGTTDILGEDQYLLFLFKKTERVVAALYVVTSFFMDIEPLKWKIRDSGTCLLKYTLSFTERAMVRSKESLSDTLAEIAHLLSLLDLAYVANLLSPMNFSIVKKELESMVGIIEGGWRIPGASSSPAIFQESFFGIPKAIFSDTKEGRNEAVVPLSQNVGQRRDTEALLHSLGDFERFEKSQKDIYKGQTGAGFNVLNKRTPISAKKTQRISGQRQITRLLSNQIKEGRKQSILMILKQGNSATTKDLSTSISGCSEKTIQRLLIEMVQGGVLKREGKRRWSRYFIVKQPEVV